MIKKAKGLGRGLDALLDSSEDQTGSLMTLPVEQLRPGKYQPRSLMDEEALDELANSIRAQGIMQPILVRPVGLDQYEIIAGERRWRASQRAGLGEVPVLVRDIPDESALAMALIENIQRENLNPLEEAIGMQRLIDEFGLTHEKVAEAVGKSRSTVTNLLRLTQLSEPVRDMLMSGQIDMGHARALLPLTALKQVELARQAALKGLSVREVERLVGLALNPPAPKPEQRSDPDVVRLETDLADRLGATVRIQTGRKGSGKLTIEYASLDQLDEILGRLG